jgi:ribosomal RNA-processing protein 12
MFLTLVIPYIRPDSLHLLVSHLMEAIMGVKEHSEKSRRAAFELLVAMGGKMGEGGTIKLDLLNGPGNLDDERMEREASIEEFVKMVGASLVADTDHTISAGIMSLSRVLFEFKGTSISHRHRLLLISFV